MIGFGAILMPAQTNLTAFELWCIIQISERKLMEIKCSRWSGDNPKPSEQLVEFDNAIAGSVWKELVNVVNSKGIYSKQWRWFARSAGDNTALGRGRGTWVAKVFGAGYKSKDDALRALVNHRSKNDDAETDAQQQQKRDRE